ncbi:HAD-IA family hydrolase [Umezakia ovalisporum]|jgi:putative hydrolase of the HAD superfamily|uniref:HAD family hydrolase n=2 Tax=Umezakia ovalisporum TaxID=75695 RepID=A0AA43H221_9CYAN|nr:HAD family hydrolase [Umezakia ovalisporum]MDH6058176.1 HAD family hydrolase [Umezakia ovalisporum FSS-43]MDH6065390.1 HAD family hydrolase [Umezakia ovalisporum FSS-62]MDH6069177.1 HAD family hydrolase [Umezakia ovalisporum APH033B]MDH6071738.1 HAD family hydrolase [Umezakia ovalisporum CobakiLakeA]MDH6074251.1 HAD family hydrolase [Umezakia ovalisporum CS-1034]
MEPPKVILLDAVGTLFGVKGSVGEVYSQLAKEFDVEVSPEILNQTFLESFKASPPPIFPNAELQDIPQQEFDWWQKIVLNTFANAGVLEKFADFPGFFSELYIHFGTGEPWFVYPDVLPCLTDWRKQNIELGILSNFDSRIFSVLQSLELSSYFSSVTISTQAHVAKPDPQIFAMALAKHNCPPEAAWHIGDSLVEDYQGAKAAGLRGIWINREKTS